MQAHFCGPEGPASASLQGTEATGSSQVHTSCPALSRCASRGLELAQQGGPLAAHGAGLWQGELRAQGSCQAP